MTGTAAGDRGRYFCERNLTVDWNGQLPGSDDVDEALQQARAGAHCEIPAPKSSSTQCLLVRGEHGREDTAARAHQGGETREHCRLTDQIDDTIDGLRVIASQLGNQRLVSGCVDF